MVITENEIREALHGDMKPFEKVDQMLMQQLDAGASDHMRKQTNTYNTRQGRMTIGRGRIIMAGFFAVAAIAVIAVILFKLLPSLRSPAAASPGSDGDHTPVSAGTESHPLVSEAEHENEAEHVELSEDEAIRQSTHIVIAELVSTGEYFLFHVQETLKANSDIEDEIYVVPYPDETRMVARTIGKSYLLFMEKNSAVFYEHDIYTLLKDCEPIDSEERRTEITEKVLALADQNTAPAYYGNSFTESTNMLDILAVTYHIVTVKVIDEGVRSDAYPTVCCSCTVTNVYKGNLQKDDTIQITFFADDQVQPGKEYLVLLSESKDSAPIYTLSSRNSVFDLDHIAMNDQTVPEKADHDAMKTDDRICFTMEYAQYSTKDTSFLGILENHRDQMIGYSHAKLERMEDGEWYTIPYLPFIVETSELPVLAAGEDAICGVNVLNYAHTVSPGRYRIVVYFKDLKEYTSGGGKFDHIAYAEFEVVEGPNPEKTVYTDLKKQSLDSTQAMADGCVVVEDGKVSNEAAVDMFVRKALLGIPCEMRIVYPKEQMVRHITARGRSYYGDVFILETVFHEMDDVIYDKKVYSYIAAYDGQLVLTDFAYPENASRLGFDLSQDVPVLPLEEENLQKLQNAAENRYTGNGNIMKLYLDDACSRYTGIYFMMGMDMDYDSAERFTIGTESIDAGGEIMGDCYPEGLRPVSMSRVSDSIAAIHFVDEEGNPVTMTLDIYGKPRTLEPVDEKKTEDLSTKELLEQIVNHPNFVEIISQNTIEDGVKWVSQKCKALEIFVEREDALSSLDDWIDHTDDYLKEQSDEEIRAKEQLLLLLRIYFE